MIDEARILHRQLPGDNRGFDAVLPEIAQRELVDVEVFEHFCQRRTGQGLLQVFTNQQGDGL